MKTTAYSLLIFMTLLTACAPQGTVTPLPILASTKTPVINATSESTPTQSLEPTQMPVQVTRLPAESCSQLVDATISDAGVLGVIYTYRQKLPYEAQDGFFDSIRSNNVQLWLWSEDHPQKAAAYPLQSDAINPQIAASHNWIIFQRVFGKTKRELWVIDVNGQNEKKLASLSFDEAQARNPDIGYASLEYGWIARADKIFYDVKLGGSKIRSNLPMYDAFALIDIHSGKTIPLVESGTVNNIVFAPDGSHAAILTASKPSQAAALSNGADLRLVNTNDGSVQFSLPIQLKYDFLTYSPDGKYVLGLSYDNIVSINARDGTEQKIPLNYPLVSGASPKSTWINDSTLLVPMTNLPEGVREITDHELRQDANPSFTVWRINLIDATASPVQTFKGYAASVNFSLDGNYLTFIQNYPPGKGKAPGDEKFAAFHQPRVMMGGGSGPESPNLTLADLRTGDILATLEANNFFSWSPYPDRYIYNQIGAAVDGIHPWGIFLGQIGKDPIFLKLETGTDYPSLYYAAQWVDSERFVLNAGCRISLFSLAR